MTTGDSRGERSTKAGDDRNRVSVGSLLGPHPSPGARVWLPFFLVGLLAAAVGWIQRTVPVATVTTTVREAGPFRFVVHTYPGATNAVSIRPGALVGLEPAWLVPTLGLDALVLLASAGGTLAVVRKFESGSIAPRRVPALFVYQSATVLGMMGVFALAPVLGVVTLPVLLVGLYLLCRLFVVPVHLAWGESIPAAVHDGYAKTAGNVTPILGTLLVLGLAGHLLVSVPVYVEWTTGFSPPPSLGTLVATTVVGTAHAVATVRAANRLESPEGGRDGRRR